MTTILSVLRKALISAGYLADQVVEDYVFSDVLLSNPTNRIAKLAAFTQSPPSYRTAAIAAVEGTDETASELVQRYRVRIPVKATMHSGAWRPLDPVDDDQGSA